MRNIELKASIADFDQARQTAESIAGERPGAEHQTDTYFRCHRGRLKLRQTDRSAAQLIWYARANEPGAKASDYQVVPVSNPETLKNALSAALGVRVIVEKHREIFVWRNVRIHLDRVDGLGEFLEFEAVLGPEEDNATGHAAVEELRALFRIDQNDLVSGSYSDLLG